MSPSILIAGGYGFVGGQFATMLRAAAPQARIQLAGRNPETGADLAARLGATTCRLDLTRPLDLDLEGVDLIVATVHDRADRLVEAAIARGIAHIGITRLAGDVAPTTFAALRQPPARPVVLAGHWQAGVLTQVAAHAAAAFARVERVDLVAVWDERDPVGAMSAADGDSFLGPALVRSAGTWSWVDAESAARRVHLDAGVEADGVPVGVLDVPSLAAITGAPEVRFDLVLAPSIGSRAGGAASHDVIVDLEGVLIDGSRGRRRWLATDPAGNGHMTAAGVAVLAGRILGTDGAAPAQGGLHTPDTLVPASAAIEQWQRAGIVIREVVHA